VRDHVRGLIDHGEAKEIVAIDVGHNCRHRPMTIGNTFAMRGMVSTIAPTFGMLAVTAGCSWTCSFAVMSPPPFRRRADQLPRLRGSDIRCFAAGE
jgi:hypothetical protein